MPNSGKAIVKNNFLVAGDNHIPVDSPSWFEWLFTAKRFSFKTPRGNFLAQRETRQQKTYWYAYRRAGKLKKAYLGKTEELTLERLEQTLTSLIGQKLFEQLPEQPEWNQTAATGSRIDTSFLPLTKVNVPALPRQLIPRPRLTRQINTPLTVIYAPSGFGKSTLLNDWKQSCGYPVAWLTVDDGDNDVIRFWYSVIMALQVVDPEIGKELFAYLGTATSLRSSEVTSRLTNDIVGCQTEIPHFALVLDDFHRIHRSEIYDSIQAWLEYLPSNMQLVILGHTTPPLSLGHLRSKGRLTELDANDLRFTLDEGIEYLRQYQKETPLAYDDLVKLVKHTEGWAAGLTLAALALNKQDNYRQFVDTFSGAHIYMREYFMETVFERSNPKVQDFLLKTAILKQLTGSLCDAVTGQTSSEAMLTHLWNENLFIVRLEEQGWYRYHDLFAEMLLSQLKIRHPDQITQLHQQAAQWYREQYAPADAIYHLLAIEAWEEAALLMEEMVLRELEQYGEDSRLLRWLQELPTTVVQKHRTLLFVYLRLAQVALPRQKIENYISHIETRLTNRAASQLTQDEQGVLFEIRQIRNTWEKGDYFIPPPRHGSENDAKWELLNGMRLLGQTDGLDTNLLDQQISELLHKAQIQKNIFVLLMAGGGLARRFYVHGQLQRSEKLARQVLEQALAQRGTLPEPSSIALATLSQIYLERNELETAEHYLNQAQEVDPNPTSTNMPIQAAIQRIEMQIAQQNFAEALANIQSARDLHLQRPSGIWTDQDLLVYEALIHIRKGDALRAEQIANEATPMGEHGLLQLIQAEILLIKKHAYAAEKMLGNLIEKYPNGIVTIPLMPARVLLARALFEQNKTHQSLQVIKDAIRLATPEQFIRPFLNNSATCCLPLLSLALQTENLTGEAQAFIKKILRLINHGEKATQISTAELKALSTSASISPREQEVLHLINAGYSNREMAVKLSISESTVKTHVGNIYHKLNVSSRVQAITRARELKLV